MTEPDFAGIERTRVLEVKRRLPVAFQPPMTCPKPETPCRTMRASASSPSTQSSPKFSLHGRGTL